MKKFFLFILFLLIIGVVGAQFALPTYVESQLESELNKTLQPTSQTVSIDSTPAFKLLYGQADAVSGTLENVKLGKLNFASFHYKAQDVKINPVSLLATYEVDVLSMGPASLEGVVVADDLKQFFVENVSGLQEANVQLTNERVTVSGGVNLLGAIRGRGSLEGRLEFKNNALVFSPTRFTINGTTISGLTSQFLEPITIYDFNNFPVPVKVESVVVENGEIHIKIKPVLN
ncbi:LmeA family phospholipid-binding protein [Veillonella caviae]|uniref:LmeA family phospholipid-binding protein n=1 Tax=Veillonella caviae TaxID=248316 RepID=UPI0023F90BE0|nr:LmeA family phospholipid-binding protein [Veillonella caviae]